MLPLSTVPLGGGTTFRRSYAEGVHHMTPEQLIALQIELVDSRSSAVRPGLRVLPVQGRVVVFW